MAMPTYIDMIEPSLRHRAAHPEGVTTTTAYAVIAAHFTLTDDEQEALLPGGTHQVFKNRAGWRTTG